MNILNIARAIKKCQSMKSEILSLKTIVSKLDFISKIAIIQLNIRKK